MASKKRTSRQRRSSRTRSNRSPKLVRNGVMSIVVPVAVAGVGVGAYLLWKKSRASASNTGRSAGAPAALMQDAASAASDAAADVVSPIVSAASAAKNAANAAFQASRDYILPTFNSAKAAASGIGSYYDVSAAGAPYQGMFGLGSTAVSQVEPHDLARRAVEGPRLRPVTQPFAARVVRTGGLFQRDLFTGQ